MVRTSSYFIKYSIHHRPKLMGPFPAVSIFFDDPGGAAAVCVVGGRVGSAPNVHCWLIAPPPDAAAAVCAVADAAYPPAAVGPVEPGW